MVNVAAIYNSINVLYGLLFLFAVIYGVYKIILIGRLIGKRANIISYNGPAALTMSNEYSWGMIGRQLIVAVFCLNFIGLFNGVASDISGNTYRFQLASFNQQAESSLLLFGALYEALRAYGMFVILSVYMKFSRNQDPFVQRGETPNSKLAWQLFAGFCLVFILEIMEEVGQYITLIPFTAVTEIIKSVQ